MSEFPPLPSSVFSHLGPIPVTFKELEAAHGMTDYIARTVALRDGQHPSVDWSTYFHEAIHVALWDGGIKLPKKVEENICDVLGTYLAAAVLNGFLRVDETRPMKVTP